MERGGEGWLLYVCSVEDRVSEHFVKMRAVWENELYVCAMEAVSRCLGQAPLQQPVRRCLSGLVGSSVGWLMPQWAGWFLSGLVGASVGWLVPQWAGWCLSGLVGASVGWLVPQWAGWCLSGLVGASVGWLVPQWAG